jgi:hypothetical protein
MEQDERTRFLARLERRLYERLDARIDARLQERPPAVWSRLPVRAAVAVVAAVVLLAPAAVGAMGNARGHDRPVVVRGWNGPVILIPDAPEPPSRPVPPLPASKIVLPGPHKGN